MASPQTSANAAVVVNLSRADSFPYIWEDAMQYCKESLGRHDWEELQEYGSCEDLLQSIDAGRLRMNKDPVRKAMRSVTPNLDRIKIFMGVFAFAMQNSFAPTALIWGLLHVLLEAAASNVQTLDKINAWLTDMSTDLLLFRDYDWLLARNSDLRHVLLNVYVDVIKFWALIIPQTRKSHGAPIITSSRFTKDFEGLLDSIQRGVHRLKERAQAVNARLAYESQQNIISDNRSQHAMQQARNHSASSFNNIPFPRNPWFLGREDILNDVRDRLGTDELSHDIKTVVLWGTAGIGKTQLALHYALDEKDAAKNGPGDGTPIIMWIKCETDLQVSQSLQGIVTKLSLIGPDEQADMAKCRILLFRWLAASDEKWLMVFDNVEKAATLRALWPHGMSGSVLVTTRHRILAPDLTGEGLQVPLFDDKQGSVFLRKVIARSDYNDDEVRAAERLSSMLGGLPLALNLMGKQVKARGRRISQFVDIYRQNPDRMHAMSEAETADVFYKEGLKTAWSTSFEPIRKNAQSYVTLGIMSCMGPERIPRSVFELEQSTELPDKLDFCHDPFDFDEALKPLLDYSLVSNDADPDYLTLHRLVQSSFRNWLNRSDLYHALWHTAILLSHSFPRHELGLSLRAHYDVCRLLAPHVQTLATCYREHKFSPEADEDMKVFLSLLGSFCWYLMENNFWIECQEVMKVAETMCNDKSSLEYAHLCNIGAIIECERGHAAKAWPYIKETLTVRAQHYSPEDHANCDHFTQEALVIMTENAGPDALALAEGKLRHVIELAKPFHSELNSVLHHHYANLAVCLSHQGKFQEALKWCLLSKEHAFNDHFMAASNYDHGNICYNQGQWDEAATQFEAAERIFSEENPLAPHATASQLKLGCIDMKQGNYKKAISRLKKTVDLCRVGEASKGDAGDTARVMRRLADALIADGQEREGQTLQHEAEAVRRKLQGPRADELGDSERSYNMLVFVAFW